MPGHGRVNTDRLDFVTHGTYQVYRATDSALAWTDGTEVEIERLSNQIAAVTKDEMFSWVKGQFVLMLSSTATTMRFEWFVIRMNASDAVPNMDDSDTVELLHKEKRIYARGFVSQANLSYAPIKPVKFEFYNVRLRDGEELRFILKPWTTHADGIVRSIVEWRQVGV